MRLTPGDAGVTRARVEDRGLGTVRSATAFLLTSLIVAAGVTAFALTGLYGVAGFEAGRDAGFVLVVFVAVWVITILAGVTVGIPVLLGLRRLGLHRRLEGLLAAGLIAGIFVSAGLATLIAGPALRGSPFVIALGAGAGLAAGASWWLLAIPFRSENG
ncbi:MAG TPA: hypothetical protein VF574_03295 [Allosphingosinicella sp.]